MKQGCSVLPVLAATGEAAMTERALESIAQSENARWYVVQTQPHAESKAVAHLARQGFETYLPRYLKKRRHARKLEVIGAPLFPGYLFVSIDVTSQRWRAIQSTIGVSRLLCHGDCPAAISTEIVDGLKRGVDERGFVKLNARPKFVVGDQVRVLEGVFASSLGLFEGTTAGERVSILLDLLGRKVRVVLDWELLTAA